MRYIVDPPKSRLKRGTFVYCTLLERKALYVMHSSAFTLTGSAIASAYYLMSFFHFVVKNWNIFHSFWKLHPTKRRINFTDKKGIGELKLLGKWDIHTFDVKLIKRVRIVGRADGYYVQFCVKVDNQSIAAISHAQVGIDVGLETRIPCVLLTGSVNLTD